MNFNWREMLRNVKELLIFGLQNLKFEFQILIIIRSFAVSVLAIERLTFLLVGNHFFATSSLLETFESKAEVRCKFHDDRTYKACRSDNLWS